MTSLLFLKFSAEVTSEGNVISKTDKEVMGKLKPNAHLILNNGNPMSPGLVITKTLTLKLP